MISFILSFLLGDIFLQQFPEIPSNFLIINFLFINALLLLCLKKHNQLVLIIFGFATGFIWSTWYAQSTLSWTLKKDWEKQPLTAVGYISSLPKVGNYGINFEYYLDQLTYGSITEYPKSLVQISAPENIHYQVGDKWKFQVKLKRIHAVQNPNTFDYESWALTKGIRASGIVLPTNKNIMLAHNIHKKTIDRFRQWLEEKIIKYSPKTQTAPWLIALMVGERQNIDPEHWKILRKTGTNHLMVIGGLHIGILAGFAHYIFSLLWRRFPSLLNLAPAKHVGACAALFIAIIYSSISGFSLPTQRACIMLSVFIFAILGNRNINSWNAWSLALFIVLIFNPLSVLSESFWLSFSTIALIIYGMGNRIFPSGIWWKWGRVQWVIGLGLIPLTLLLYQECSLISFLANSLAIPWLAITILPLCFLSAIFLIFSSTIGSFLLLIADKSMCVLWLFLSWISQFDFSSWNLIIPNLFTFILMMIGFLFFLLPAGFPGRWLGCIWIMPALLYQPIKPGQGDFWLTLLDVGQGLAVIIQTSKHTLIYDTGPKYSISSDMGENVVLPYLRKIKTKNIDMMVISHGDNDHIGGAQAILETFPYTIIKTSVPEKMQSRYASLCQSGQTWKWDDINFTFIYPDYVRVNANNDNSCVLLIDNGKNRVLLTGDIEKNAEKKLLAISQNDLSANIIIAPHHGSKTSGLEKFINAVNPQIVLYSTGYRNRYHFPHKSVVAAYEKIHAKPYNTVDSGAIEFKISKDDDINPPYQYRILHKKYWYD